MEKKTEQLKNAIATKKEQALNVITDIEQTFDCSKIKTAQDGAIYIKSALLIGDKLSLPIARICYIVRSKKWYVPAKNFNEWALKNFGFKKSSANNYAKVGEWLTDDGNHSLLPHLQQDFSFSQLVVIAESLNLQDAIEKVENGEITPFMTVAEIKKRIKKDKNDITEYSEIGEVKTETETETETVKEKLTTADKVTSMLLFIKDNENNDDIIDKCYNALSKIANKI